jgi:hypothetical protein
VQCALGQFERAIKKVREEKDPAKRKALVSELALPCYRGLVESYGRMYRYLLATVSTNGGIATVINLEHNAGFRPRVIESLGRELSQLLGGPLPVDTQPPKQYGGEPRLIVPTVRSSLLRGEVLKLKVIVLSGAPPRGPALWWREMGRGAFKRLRFEHVARGVYEVSFPPGGATSDLEYYVEASGSSGRVLRFPATAPAISQTLVLIPAG